MVDLSAFVQLMPLMAVGLDLLLGDPRWLPHPVRFIGTLADAIESYVRTASAAPPTRWTGFFAAVALVALVSIFMLGLSTLGSFGLLLTIYMCGAGLALRSLLVEAGKVHFLLECGQLTEAKVALSMLVSRDTGMMTEADMRRSLAETLSENLNDGFTAPLFWLCIGGPVGMWGYKTISTLDSMWGYKTEQYKDFGWFAARADDVLAYLPARLTALVMIMVGACLRLHAWAAIKRTWRDADKMESPNAGWPMAAAAWLVGAQMGGLTSYHGKMKYKPLLGPSGQTWSKEKYKSLRTLAFGTGMVLAVIGQLAVLYAPGFFH